MSARILLVDNTAEVGTAVASLLEANRFTVVREDDPHRVPRRLEDEHFDVVVIEVKAAADDGGIRLLRDVHGSLPHVLPRIVVISNDPSPDVQREFDAIGVCDVVFKPVRDVDILAAVRECLDRTPATVH